MAWPENKTKQNPSKLKNWKLHICIRDKVSKRKTTPVSGLIRPTSSVWKGWQMNILLCVKVKCLKYKCSHILMHYFKWFPALSLNHPTHFWFWNPGITGFLLCGLTRVVFAGVLGQRLEAIPFSLADSKELISFCSCLNKIVKDSRL